MTPAIHKLVLAVGGSLPASIVAKATIAAVLGLIGARTARRSRAAVRHALLAAAFGVLLLLPAASIVAPRVHIVVAAEGQDTAKPMPPAGAVPSIPAFDPIRSHATRLTGEFVVFKTFSLNALDHRMVRWYGTVSHSDLLGSLEDEIAAPLGSAVARWANRG